MDAMARNAVSNLEWYNKLSDSQYKDVLPDVNENLGDLQSIIEIHNKNNPDSVKGKQYESMFDLYIDRWMSFQQKRGNSR